MFSAQKYCSGEFSMIMKGSKPPHSCNCNTIPGLEETVFNVSDFGYPERGFGVAIICKSQFASQKLCVYE